jgi:WD40 repeat protein
VWRVSDGTLLQTLEGHTNTVNKIFFSPNSQLLISGSQDGTIRVWGIKP